MKEDGGGYTISEGKMVAYSFTLRYTFSISSSFSAFLAGSMSMASLPLIKAHPAGEAFFDGSAARKSLVRQGVDCHNL